ncbi:hypothetical protein PROFUN_07448 [Planoprotostelium fungivorum]|uniref:Uncharacterized protein n=1 Tax=Planoprotostelium fungivorum TaxID=1890364 RepID=A0A2P6NLF7_9EUKA|nr:hypothetical protein PROFUN_07448 [Planoprotostelium fungivorum]
MLFRLKLRMRDPNEISFSLYHSCRLISVIDHISERTRAATSEEEAGDKTEERSRTRNLKATDEPFGSCPASSRIIRILTEMTFSDIDTR